jgi:peptide/nickel transport system permease protein
VTTSPAPQSQAALIWRQFRRRPLAVAAGVVIVVLVTVSIWAPFLAHDRPLFYRGVNKFEFKEAVRTLRELIGRLDESTAKSTVKSPRAETLRVIGIQGRLMRAQLPADRLTTLDQLLQAARTDAPDSAKVREWQRTLRQEFGGNDIVLVSRTAWPVVASLHWADILFMAWNLSLLSAWIWWPAVFRLIPGTQPGRRKLALLACSVGVPALCAFAWWWCVPFRIDRTNYKAAVLAADETAATAPVVFETVLWPPVPFGVDENVLANSSLKPALWKEDADRRPQQLGRWDQPHWLGTDELGRDVLCRMFWGGRVSLAVGIVAVAIYVSIGVVVGSIAGYFRGVCDLFVSRIIEVIICFPAFFLILTIVALRGPGLFNIMVVIGLTSWTGIARLVRGEFLRLVDQEFVLAGRALGYSPARLIFRHILPNALAPVLVSATFGVAGAILTESSLSFLGLGITAPTPSWGGVLSSGREAIFRAPWLILFPGLAIFVTITCYNLVGEALRDASDPRLRGSR